MEVEEWKVGRACKGRSLIDDFDWMRTGGKRTRVFLGGGGTVQQSVILCFVRGKERAVDESGSSKKFILTNCNDSIGKKSFFLFKGKTL